MYLVGTSATGAWAGHDSTVATYFGAAWTFLTPFEGLRVYVKDTDRPGLFDGTAWLFDAHHSTGTAMPASPVSGDTCMRTDLDYEVFFYDSTRTKWLSVATYHFAYVESGAVAASPAAMQLPSSIASATLRGSVSPFDGTIIRACGQWTGGPPTTCLFNFYDGATLRGSTSDTGAALNFNQGALDFDITASLTPKTTITYTGTGPANVAMDAYWKRRAS